MLPSGLPRAHSGGQHVGQAGFGVGSAPTVCRTWLSAGTRRRGPFRVTETPTSVCSRRRATPQAVKLKPSTGSAPLCSQAKPFASRTYTRFLDSGRTQLVLDHACRILMKSASEKSVFLSSVQVTVKDQRHGPGATSCAPGPRAALCPKPSGPRAPPAQGQVWTSV